MGWGGDGDGGGVGWDRGEVGRDGYGTGCDTIGGCGWVILCSSWVG